MFESIEAIKYEVEQIRSKNKNVFIMTCQVDSREAAEKQYKDMIANYESMSAAKKRQFVKRTVFLDGTGPTENVAVKKTATKPRKKNKSLPAGVELGPNNEFAALFTKEKATYFTYKNQAHKALEEYMEGKENKTDDLVGIYAFKTEWEAKLGYEKWKRGEPVGLAVKESTNTTNKADNNTVTVSIDENTEIDMENPMMKKLMGILRKKNIIPSGVPDTVIVDPPSVVTPPKKRKMSDELDEETKKPAKINNPYVRRSIPQQKEKAASEPRRMDPSTEDAEAISKVAGMDPPQAESVANPLDPSKEIQIDSFMLLTCANKIKLYVDLYDIDFEVNGNKSSNFLVVLDLVSVNQYGNEGGPFWLFKPDLIAGVKNDLTISPFLGDCFNKIYRTFKRSMPFGKDERHELSNTRGGRTYTFPYEMLAFFLPKEEGLNISEVAQKNLSFLSTLMTHPVFQGTLHRLATFTKSPKMAALFKPLPECENDEKMKSLFIHLKYGLENPIIRIQKKMAFNLMNDFASATIKHFFPPEANIPSLNLWPDQLKKFAHGP